MCGCERQGLDAFCHPKKRSRDCADAGARIGGQLVWKEGVDIASRYGYKLETKHHPFSLPHANLLASP